MCTERWLIPSPRIEMHLTRRLSMPDALIQQAGADTFVAGSSVFSAPNGDKGYRTIMQQLRTQAFTL